MAEAAARPVRLVLFDMDNVLCRYDRKARTACLAAIAGLTADAVEQAIWGSGYEYLGDSGALNASDYLRGFGERLNHPLSLEEWIRARRVAMTPDPDVLGLVARLRDRVGLAVLTNNTTLVADHINDLFPQLRPLFGASIFSAARFKAAKPDRDCYLRCLAELGMPPEDTLFIDDHAPNVAGARAAGLRAHHHTSLAALRDTLHALQLL